MAGSKRYRKSINPAGTASRSIWQLRLQFEMSDSQGHCPPKRVWLRKGLACRRKGRKRLRQEVEQVDGGDSIHEIRPHDLEGSITRRTSPFGHVMQPLIESLVGVARRSDLEANVVELRRARCE